MNATAAIATPIRTRPDLDRGLGGAGQIGFAAALAAILYIASSIYRDASAVGVVATTYCPTFCCSRRC